MNKLPKELESLIMEFKGFDLGEIKHWKSYKQRTYKKYSFYLAFLKYYESQEDKKWFRLCWERNLFIYKWEPIIYEIVKILVNHKRRYGYKQTNLKYTNAKKLFPIFKYNYFI